MNSLSRTGQVPIPGAQAYFMPDSSKNVNPNRRIIFRPYLDFQSQRELLEAWIEKYNVRVSLERKARIKACKPILDHERDYFQTIKSPQRQFLLEIFRQCIEQVADDSKTLRGVGGHRLDPSQPYSLFTNSVKTASRLGYSSGRSVRNQLTRAVKMGVIVERKFHGTQLDYELLINPQFLLFFDLDNPEIQPSSNLLGETKEWAFPTYLRKKLPLFQKERTERTLNNSIKTERTDEQPSCQLTESDEEGSSASLTREDKQQNTPKNAKSVDDRLRDLCPHPALSSPEESKEHQTRAARHPLEAQIRPLVLHFLWYAHRKLWDHQEIFDQEYRRTFEYIVESYFDKCSTLKAVRDQISRLEQVVDQQAKWVEAEPGRFTMYPRQFFDRERQLAPLDYSGAIGVRKKIFENQQKMAVAKSKKKQVQLKRAYRRAVKEWLMNPTDTGYKELLRKVQRLWPSMVPEFIQTVRMVQGEIPRA